jgi:hypothetical protein
MWTGRGLVKKPAQFSSDRTNGTVNSSRDTRSLIQLKRWSIDLDFLGMAVWVDRPMAHSLSQNIGVGGWGYPIFLRVARPGTASWALAYAAASSASAAEPTLTGMRVEVQSMAELMKWGVWSPRVRNPPALEPEFGRGR